MEMDRIVVVTETPGLANALSAWFLADRCRVTTVTTFAAANVQLRKRPDLVITDVKLGDFNGLHLALKARHRGIPAVVIGEPDALLERDAMELGAAYVTPASLDRERLMMLAQHLMRPICRNDPGASTAGSGYRM